LKSDELKFLENVMIRSGGLYVLMGSKPMIDFPIDSGFPETEAECTQQYERDLLSFEHSISYTKYLEACKSCRHLHHRSLWNAWEKQMNNYLGPCYRFVAVNLKGRTTGFFINIPSTLITLKTYYQEFAEVNGGSFSPEQVIDEIGNQDSLFWTKLFQSSYTIGLLLGYGKRNSFLFHCEQNGEKFILPRFVDLERKLAADSKRDVQVEDLPLPEFCTFCLGDEVMENYKQQRQQIIREFRGKNFETETKHWLGIGKKLEYELREIQ
jgi:hypothetical protein